MAEEEYEELEYQDGDVVELPMGWTMEIVARDDGSPQGFVIAPDGQESASLAFAVGTGETSGDREIPIPRAVLRDLEQYVEDYS